MGLNRVDKIIKNIWKSLPNHHPVKLNAFQIMPNHVHFVIQIMVWQRNYYEHIIRNEQDLNKISQYIPVVAHFANILSKNELTNGYTRSKFICKWYRTALPVMVE